LACFALGFRRRQETGDSVVDIAEWGEEELRETRSLARRDRQ
jgi:hypothetical protein